MLACDRMLPCSTAAAPPAVLRGLRVGRATPRPAPVGSGWQRGAAAQRRTVSARAASSGTARGLLTEPWDAAPQNWRRFWATKLAAAVVESDQAAETLRVRPVEMSGLDWPPSQEEAQRRVRTNVTLYRQNYVCCALACLAAGAVRNVALLVALACIAAAALVHSDRLLGELSLALDGQLVWNAKRVAGVDRNVLRYALPGAAVVCLALSPAQSARWLVTSACTASVLALLHAVMRPVDLEAVMGSFLGDLTAAKTRCERDAHAADAKAAFTRPCAGRMSAARSQLPRKAFRGGGRSAKQPRLRLSPSSWSNARRTSRPHRHSSQGSRRRGACPAFDV